MKTHLQSPEPEKANNLCGNCGEVIQIMCFKGLGFCFDDCRKALGKDII